MKQTLNLDVDSPEKVAIVLQAAADVFYEASVEVEYYSQDKGAGKPWIKIARILERAADKIDREIR